MAKKSKRKIAIKAHTRKLTRRNTRHEKLDADFINYFLVRIGESLLMIKEHLNGRRGWPF